MILHPELFVLIESDWNLKEVDAVGIPVGLYVLIESDWNLKYDNAANVALQARVLIESDWNLKIYLLQVQPPALVY